MAFLQIMLFNGEQIFLTEQGRRAVHGSRMQGRGTERSTRAKEEGERR